MNKTQQRGFTLIELVVVIVILGILAAFAVPRFMGMEGRARVATLQSLQGSLRSGAAMAHGVWMADGTNAAKLAMGGKTVAFTNGYPDAASADELIQDVSGAGFTLSKTVAGQFEKNGAPDPTNCFVKYTATASVNTAPAVTTSTKGCGT